MPSNPPPTLLIDASSLAYRAYHAMPEWRGPDGTLTNAALGFLNFLSRLIPDRKAGEIGPQCKAASRTQPDISSAVRH